MWEDLLAALALVFVVEGVMPFVNPAKWRRYLQMVSEQSDRGLRFMGLFSMLLGVAILAMVRAVD